MAERITHLTHIPGRKHTSTSSRRIVYPGTLQCFSSPPHCGGSSSLVILLATALVALRIASLSMGGGSSKAKEADTTTIQVVPNPKLSDCDGSDGGPVKHRERRGSLARVSDAASQALSRFSSKRKSVLEPETLARVRALKENLGGRRMYLNDFELHATVGIGTFGRVRMVKLKDPQPCPAPSRMLLTSFEIETSSFHCFAVHYCFRLPFC